MAKIFAKTLIMLLMFVTVAAVPALALAATQTVTVGDLGFEEDLVVSGALSHTTIDFPLPAATFLPGSTVNVVIEPSQKLSDASRFMFFLDNRPVSTVNAAQLRTNPVVRLPVPAGLKGGESLRLDIKANVFATGDLAADRINGDLFYTLRNSSKLSLNYAPVPVKTVAGFISKPHKGIVVVVPNYPTLDEAAAGSWVYGMLQKSFPHQAVKLITADERNLYPGQSRVWVAAWGHLPAALAKATGGITLADAETLVITAADDAELKTEARRLSTMLPRGTLPGFGLADDNGNGRMVPDKNKEVVFFGNDVPREGILAVPIEFTVYPAMLADAPRRLAFHLECRYSASLSKQSRVDVLFNGSLIHSEVLDGSGKMARDIMLPRSLELDARNVLRVEFNYPEANFLGINGPVQSAQILTSSYFTGISSFPKDKHSWASIGMLAQKAGLVLLGNGLSVSEIKGAAEAVYLLNRQLPPGEFACPEFRALSDYKGIGTNVPYLFVVGTTDEVPEEMLAAMPLRSVRDGIINGARYPFIGQVGRYRDIPVMMVVSAADGAGLADVLRQLGTNRGYGKVTGNVFVRAEDGSLTAVDGRQKSATLEVLQQDWLDLSIVLWHKALRWIEQYQQPLLIALGIIVAVLIITRLLEKRQNRKSGKPGKRA